MMQFSRQEAIDISIAVAVLTLIFSYPNIGLSSLILSFLVVVTAFFLHEMAHKYMGIRYGCEAYFKLWPSGLLLGLVSIFLPIKFAAPGATVISPRRHGRWMFKETRLTMYEMGMISFAGPMTNIILSLVFLPLSHIYLFAVLSYINAWLAFFNLMPVPPLDGSKVILWKTWLWLLMIIVSGAITFLI